jgi:hypothetical protein
LGAFFLPGIYMLMAPAKVLAAFGLADSFLLGPNTAGVIVLVALYAGLAYVVTRFIGNLPIRQLPP